MKWYNVHFDATKSGPLRKVRIERKVQASSPIDAIHCALLQEFKDYAYDVDEWVIDGDERIPTHFIFDECESDCEWDFTLTIDEESAVLADMVSELSPDAELRMMGAPTLFDEVNA